MLQRPPASPAFPGSALLPSALTLLSSTLTLLSSVLIRVLAGGLLLSSLAGCSLLDRNSAASPSTTPTPVTSPSVWLSAGRKTAVRQARDDLVRLSDLPGGYKASPLTLGSSKGVTPKACAAVLGPALALVTGSSGHASTAFVSTSTAIAHTVGVFTTVTAAQGVLTKAMRLATTCRSMTAQGTRLTVQAGRTTVHGQDAVVLTEKQKAGAERIVILVEGKLASVLAVAALPPGPDPDLLETATEAASQRLGG